MKRLDLRKQLAKYYTLRRGTIAVVDVPELQFLMIDGRGDPNTSQAFREAVNALYSLSYTMKFMLKKGKKAVDYPVMPLEGLWWAADAEDFLKRRKDEWNWTVMIMQPEVVTRTLYAEAAEELRRKKKDLPALGTERLEHFTEGLSAQILHIGPYDAEGPTIKQLHDHIKENGYTLRGKHHEIYFGDPRRANPATLKTLLRQPMQKP